MTGQEFLAAYGSKGAVAWEGAALKLAESGELVKWPLLPVVFTDGSRKLTVLVASDYLAVGTPEDPLRLPLTPITAQQIANVYGMLLPTPKMVKTIHEQATAKLPPRSVAPNKGASLAQYAEHNALLQASGVMGQGLTSGIKKDVVIGNAWRPGKVLIYGWMKPDVPPGKDPSPTATLPWRVQAYSSVHGDFYVDYSHGIRLIHPWADLNGTDVRVEDILKSPVNASLLSDEGALKMVRYPIPGSGLAPTPLLEYIPGTTRIVDLGLHKVQLSYEYQGKGS